MARLPEVSREQLSPEDQSIYDEIAGERGQVRGPYAALMHSPKLARRASATGSYVRFGSALPMALREVATLATAREMDAQYVFSVHAPVARGLEIAETTMEALRRGDSPPSLSPDEALVVAFVRELLRNRRVSDATFDAVKERFGVQGVVDLAGTVGHYAFMTQVINALDVGLPPGTTPELPT